jgi:hypothetical protein
MSGRRPLIKGYFAALRLIVGAVMSGRRPLIKGYFAALRLIVGAVMSSACRCGS